MKLFLPNGFKLDTSSPTYCDHVLEVGQQSEENMFKSYGAMRKSESPVLKQLRKYYHESKLYTLITEFRGRVALETILDQSPCDTQDLFLPSYVFWMRSSLALHNSMIQTIGTRDRVPEALRTIFVSLKKKCKAKRKKKRHGLVELDDIQERLLPPTKGAVGQVCGTYGMRCLLQRVAMGNKPHYLVDWESTPEPRDNIAKELVTQLKRDRHELVCSTFIDDEAVEDNTLNSITPSPGTVVARRAIDDRTEHSLQIAQSPFMMRRNIHATRQRKIHVMRL
ncbi:LOW QUALITY PROTEIN: hypothetical protein PHMEG_00016326 [Phytophthora megakarya]|uniref:Uncharacterized protein n=1 Tax=Phytophthora megakarya TaxID=4795 RepID=A0A225W070_9STRA|nr:LOW QUALITY PROTEIN: hypothetical protein PHMEG_00016326 [Phytophthora megakarya]